MRTPAKVETSRSPCECGKGEFVFYACEADRWLYVGNPREKWFEMHIFCEACAGLFQQHKISILSENDFKPHWRIVIPELNQVPPH